MTSETAYVWITLPGTTKPIVAGRLDVNEEGGTFVYGETYLGRDDKVELDPSELPLTEVTCQVEAGRHGGLPGAIRDALPDSWGRYVLGAHGKDRPSEVALLLQSPDDHVGALVFSASARELPISQPPAPTLVAIEALGEARRRQREEQSPRPTTDAPPTCRTQAVAREPHTSLGGARPKITVFEDGALWLAKINEDGDEFDYARTEAAMLDLARLCDIEAPDAVVRRFGKSIALLVRRFDRKVRPDGGVERTRFVSALTCLKADEGDREPQSYLRLADEVRRVGDVTDGPELFRRMVFNALIGNGDDHLRNHGLLAVGSGWRLSPVYDLVPRPTHSQRMRSALVVGESGEREFTVRTVLAACGRFDLSEGDAKAMIADMADIVARRWHEVLRARGLSDLEIGRLRSAFLNPGLGLNPTDRPSPVLSVPPLPR